MTTRAGVMFDMSLVQPTESADESTLPPESTPSVPSRPESALLDLSALDLTPPEGWADHAEQLLGQPVRPEVVESLTRLYGLLLVSNAQFNLTRITDREGYWYRHVLESLWLSRWIPERGSKKRVWLCDVGSGAGFPALPLALLREDMQVVALESMRKKATYLTATGEALGLGDKRLRVVCDRAEVLGHQPESREQFAVVTARALANLSTLLELCIPLIKVGGQVLALKGPKWEEELAAADKAMHRLKATVIETATWQSPVHPAPVTVMVIGKTAQTHASYPRSAGTPGKSPL